MIAIRGAAAITGAASGVSRALAIELASRSCDLALADRDEAGLKTLAAEIGAVRKVSVHRVDVGEPRILIGNDARFMDPLQRFRPRTYWAPLQRRLEKMAKGT